MLQIDLFAVCPESRQSPASDPAKSRARAKPPCKNAQWEIEDHVCRHCFGRMVSTRLSSGATRYRCTNCGAEGEGHAPSVLCACGLKLRSAAPGLDLVDAGIRCVPNPSPSAAFPSQIVAAESRT
jgi:hypothetical protein